MRKLPWITSLSVCAVSLIVGASFHGLRMHPENAESYRLGCVIGTVMASLAGAALVTSIVLFILYKRSSRSGKDGTRVSAGMEIPRGSGAELCDGIHTAEKIGEGAYRIDEAGLSNSYLLLGDAAALLIDTSDGAGNLSKCVEQLTDKPVTVAVTHRHPDHIGGAWMFGEYYASKEDCKAPYNFMCRRFMCRLMVRACRQKTEFRQPFFQKTKILPLTDGQTFDLGGRVVCAEAVPGHTAGSFMFIDEREKLLFTGDDVNPCLWMQLPGCIKLNDWLPGAYKVLSYLEKGYTAWNGHEDGKQPVEQVQKTIALVKELIQMKSSGTLPERKGVYPDKNSRPNVYYNEKNI